MTKREEQYLDKLYSKFSDLLDRFMKSGTVIWPEKEPVLVNFKDMIDDRMESALKIFQVTDTELLSQTILWTNH